MAFWNKWFGKKESRTVSIRTAGGSKQRIHPERDYDNFARETYLKNATGFAAIFEVAKSTASVPWGVFDRKNKDELIEIPEDPLNKVLTRANPAESFSFLMLKMVSYLVMCGNAFNEKVALEGGPNKGQIRELYSHRPDRFEFDIIEGRLNKYIHTVDGKKTVWEVDPITGESDILQLKTFHPLNDWWGAAATESAAREIDTSNAATSWNRSLLDNQGKPGLVFTLIGNWTPDQFDEMEQYLEARSGPDYAGKNLVIGGERGTNAAPYGFSPADMDFGEGDIRLMRKIAMAYGVPPELLGIESSTFNNRKEARLYFWENTVVWYLNYIRGEFNNWLFEPDSTRFVNYILDDVPAFAEKRDMLWTRAKESDFLCIDEKREMVGMGKYEPTDEPGSQIFIEASKVPLGYVPETEETESGETEVQARQRLLDEGYDEEEIDEMLGLE